MTLPSDENYLDIYCTKKTHPTHPRNSIETGYPQLSDTTLPSHPIPCMQGAFNESIMESETSGAMPEEQVVRKIDAETRRQQLLESEDFSTEYSSRWMQKPGAKFHPLWKLIAQISFGVHLLQQNQAKSDEEVLRILQVHVDEVDGFLEDTTADFDLAVRDVEERVKFLRLPLEYGETFNTMLNDKTFRTSIVESNDVIERIIDRTTKAMSHSLLDVGKGMDATAELAKFLERIGPEWTKDDERLFEIYNTMRGNAEGWYRAFTSLQDKGVGLEKLLTQLGVLATEMARRAGNASRRQTNSHRRGRSETSAKKAAPLSSSSTSRYKQNSPSDTDKPLPPDPLQRLISATSSSNDRVEAVKGHVRQSRSHQSSPSRRWDVSGERQRRASSSIPRETNRPFYHKESGVPKSSKLETLSSPDDVGPRRRGSASNAARTENLSTVAAAHSSTGDARKAGTESPDGYRAASPNMSNSDSTNDYIKYPADAHQSSGMSQPYSSDPEPIENLLLLRRNSDSMLHTRASLAPTITPITNIPQFSSGDNFGAGKWLMGGKKSLASVKGIFNKKKPLKKASLAILV